MVITIIGGGSTSISFLYNYLQLMESESEAPITIYLVEKRGTFGPGAAYCSDSTTNILNTKTGYITPFHDKPGDFYHWLQSNEDIWRRRFPAFSLDPDSYAPRPLFGMYLQSRMAWLVKHALTKGVRIIQIDAEAKDVAALGASYVTRTDCSLSLTSDYVFLFCGTLPAKQLPFAQKSDRILKTPYPVSDLGYAIDKDASVGIAGARLSCIDAVIGLIESGHRGHIAIHSRSGYFPSVRGTQGRIVPAVLTKSNVEALVKAKGKLRLADIVQLVMEEISLISDKEIHPAIPLPPAPPTSLKAFLADEIMLAAAPRVWQAVLYSTNGIIDLLWSALDDDDKAEVLSKYFSAFMSYRVSIPVENARKILSYLESGQVSFHAGDFDAAVQKDGKICVTLKKGAGERPLVYDYMIGATGSPRSVDLLDSDLINNMLQRGTIMPHRFGGILVDPVTYSVIGSSGDANPSVFAVGELTTGTFFFTSALDINARHARNCAVQFLQTVSENRRSALGQQEKTLATANG